MSTLPVCPGENKVFVEKVLPIVKRFVCAKFRYLRGFAKDEAIANAIGLAYEHYVRALTNGKDPSKFPVALARFACLRIRSGRGFKQNRTDVMEQGAQLKFGFGRKPLEDYCGKDSSVAEETAVRIDFGVWLDSLSESRRRVVEALMEGLSTSEVAAKLGVSESNVQHLRQKCLKDWQSRHVEA